MDSRSPVITLLHTIFEQTTFYEMLTPTTKKYILYTSKLHPNYKEEGRTFLKWFIYFYCGHIWGKYRHWGQVLCVLSLVMALVNNHETEKCLIINDFGTAVWIYFLGWTHGQKTEEMLPQSSFAWVWTSLTILNHCGGDSTALCCYLHRSGC